MGVLFESRAEFREEVRRALGGATDGQPNLSEMEIRQAIEFSVGMNRRMANTERPAETDPHKRSGWDFVDKLLA